MHIKPKKSLGQNFLIDKNIQKKIIESCGLKTSDVVLEIGAGKGELTGLISDKVDIVYALEIDPCLCSILKDKFKDNRRAKIVNQDILEFNLKRHFAKCKDKIKVIGNIPYYITTPIIEYLLRFKAKINSVFITVQKEFARRIIARPGSKDYGAFSCFVQYYTEPKVIFQIKKTCFLPAPEVDSCFLKMNIRQGLVLSRKQEKLLFKIVRSAFNQRRKTLRNSLNGVIPAQKLNTFFSNYNICRDIRPEKLSLNDFINLANT